MRGYLVTAYRHKNIIYLWLRTEDGRKVKLIVTGFKPYFYVPSKLGEYVSIYGDLVDKVVLEDPSDIPKERVKYSKTFEADIPYVRRFVIDKGIYACVEVPVDNGPEITVDHKYVKPCTKNIDISPLLWILDIEVYADTMPKPDDPRYPIIAISVYDYSKKKYYTWAWHKNFKTTVLRLEYDNEPWEVRTFDEEELMLMDFVSELLRTKPDVIAGWNIGFDKDYLEARLRLFKIINWIDFVDWFDMLRADEVIVSNRRGRTLKHVTVEEGLETREEAKEASDVIPMWSSNPIEIIKYNVRDVWRVVKLNERYKYFETYLAYKEVTGLIHLEDTLSPLKIVDIMILRTAKERGVVLPTAEEGKRKIYKKYKGAVVLDPPTGIVEGVAVMDMSKYYPFLMVSFNISPEMKLKKIDPVNNIWMFRSDKRGIIPEAVLKVVSVEEALRSEQKKYKPEDPMYEVLDRKILATKGVRNSFYGAMGNEYFRLFDIDCASSITGYGREGILFIKNHVKKLGYEVVYGDTDSVFIKVPFEKAEDLAKDLSMAVRKYFKEKYNLKTEPMLELKFEKYYRRILFTGRKKRYAGWLVWKKGKETDKIDVVGFEAVRSDFAPFTGYAEERVFSLVLREGYDPGKLNKLLVELKREAKQRALDDIALYAKITRPFNEYKNMPKHVEAALYSNIYLGTKFRVGSKVKYIYVRRVKGYPPTEVVAFEDSKQIEDIVEVDWDKMYERILYNPLSKIFDAIGFRPGLSTRRWW